MLGQQMWLLSCWCDKCEAIVVLGQQMWLLSCWCDKCEAIVC